MDDALYDHIDVSNVIQEKPYNTVIAEKFDEIAMTVGIYADLFFIGDGSIARTVSEQRAFKECAESVQSEQSPVITAAVFYAVIKYGKESFSVCSGTIPVRIYRVPPIAPQS